MRQLSFADTDNREYQDFVRKFIPKKTTDDCYTPENIYEVIANYVSETYGIKREDMVRPFWPGGDYESYNYPENCCVVDNPPFSIITSICRTLADRKIKFFLFCPYLTAFQILYKRKDLTIISAPVSIIYDNGARVNTNYVTNMEPGTYVRSDPELYNKIDKANNYNIKQNKKQLPVYEYPDEILTITMMGYLARHGTAFRLGTNEACHITKMDEQKLVGKEIFGCGFLLNKKATDRKIKAQNEAKNNDTEKNENEEKIIWKLSDREKKMQKMMDKGNYEI